MNEKAALWGLLSKRPRWSFTGRGKLVALAMLAGMIATYVFGAHRFLAVNSPIYGGILVLEGWLNDEAMKDAVTEYRAHPYDRLVVTGGPLEQGTFLSSYKSYANLGAATLVQLGIDSNSLVILPAQPVKKDRTYASALALRDWLKQQNPPILKVNLLTQGAHARRSRMLFQKAVGKEVQVGVMAIEDRDFEQRRWYASSMGVRFVLSESIAYLYAKFFFFAEN
jgi:uncharacterized SAM-binding protein YcdF (DUF218 family)